jgi:hypothetical protein
LHWQQTLLPCFVVNRIEGTIGFACHACACV